MKVLEARLDLYPLERVACYEVLINGKPVKQEYTSSKEVGRNPKAPFATIGRRVECQENQRTGFEARWHAAVSYDVIATEDQRKVLMGFPIPLWEESFIVRGDVEGLDDIQVPGVVNFKSFINHREIEKVRLNGISEPNLFNTPLLSEKSIERHLAYTWTSSFVANTPYRLRTEYDFATSLSASFYEGSQYLAGQQPWFLNDQASTENIRARNLLYYLTPITLWGNPPPRYFRIKVSIGKNMPVTLAVPVTPKPVCVDKIAFYYLFENAFPQEELKMSYPKTPENLKPLRTFEDWSSWRKTLGGDGVKLSCDLIAVIKAQTEDISFQEKLSQMSCQTTCD